MKKLGSKIRSLSYTKYNSLVLLNPIQVWVGRNKFPYAGGGGPCKGLELGNDGVEEAGRLGRGGRLPLRLPVHQVVAHELRVDPPPLRPTVLQPVAHIHHVLVHQLVGPIRLPAAEVRIRVDVGDLRQPVGTRLLHRDFAHLDAHFAHRFADRHTGAGKAKRVRPAVAMLGAERNSQECDGKWNAGRSQCWARGQDSAAPGPCHQTGNTLEKNKKRVLKFLIGGGKLI